MARSAVGDGVLIVGGGLGAARTARALRDLGYSGRLRIVAEEHEAPYDRPPLSKDLLLGAVSGPEIILLTEADAAALEIELMLGARAVGLQPRRRRVRLTTGEALGYDALVIATGARARRLPGLSHLRQAHHLRTVGDARRLRSALLGTPRVAVIGGGFIGLEVAAAARALGCEVTVVEAATTPLAAVVGTELGRIVQAWHEEHGVRFRCGAEVRSAREHGGLRSLVLADGTSVAAEVAVIGVGAEPCVEWLEPSGLRMHRGVVCDRDGRTSADGVYVVGDAACRHEGGVCVAGEHWTAAAQQSLRVAKALLGRPDGGPAGDESYFWSDQYGSRLQFAGTADASTRLTIESGSVEARSFVAVCRTGGAVTGVFAMNRPGPFVRTRLALQAAAPERRRAPRGANGPAARAR
jgi:3-phenylpropionate/trans-cinnamate dioxygenase ferredoxin reductase subunit